MFLLFLLLAGTPNEIDYQKDVAPILREHCLDCHGPDEQSSGLRVDVRDRLVRGGDLGEPAVTPGKPDQSFLLQVVRGDGDVVMPPEGPQLSAKQIDILRRWIAAGAEMPGAVESEEDAPPWSFQPIAPPPLPDDIAGDEAVDWWIEQRLRPHGLGLSEPADRHSLIRRLHLVMHGLPPTPDQVRLFLEDQRPDAWRRLVEQVLASPRYGERWGRHWLDLIRFGETHGFETNRERPNAWRYRDWVIQSINDDKPYDRFVLEQLAGDALGEPLGTGFLVAGPHDIVKSPDINLTLMQRQDELADLINATGGSFLGLTLGCARCHNHKFDPITQRDYYSVQAVFAGVEHADRTLPMPERQQARLRDARQRITALEAALADFLPEDSRGRPLRGPTSPSFNEERFEATPARFVRFTIEATRGGAQPCLDELEVFAGDHNVGLASEGAEASCSSSLPGYAIHQLAHIHDGLYGNAHSWISNEAGEGWVEIQLSKTADVDRVLWARDREGRFSDRTPSRYRIEGRVRPDDPWTLLASSADRAPTEVDVDDATRYDFASAAPELAARGRAWLEELRRVRKLEKELAEPPQAYVGVFSQPAATHRLYRGDPLAKREEVAPDVVSALGSLALDTQAPEQLRRLQFARWIVHPSNPLTSRVAANRVWQHHFGAGLVDTPNDFGRNGAKPTHPELLDWLAQELVHHGWSMKHLHRVILNSRVWRQDAAPRTKGLEVDAGTRLLWRFPPRRLEAEAIRDSVLAVSKALDLRAGGPGFDGFEVELENVRHFFPKSTYGPRDWRRMIYMTKVRQEQESVFGVFDCPDASQLTPKRSRSTTPLQALSLLNSSFIMQQADLFSERLLREAPLSVEHQISLAYRLCYSREAEDDELAACREFIERESLPAFCRALLNSNEFLFVP